MQNLSKDITEKSLPTRKDEDWKYADISFLRKQDFVPFLLEKENECEYLESEKKVVLKIYNTSASLKIKKSQLPPGFKLLTSVTTKLNEFTSYSNYFLDLAAVLKNNYLYLAVTQEFPADVLIEIQMGVGLPSSSLPRMFNTQLKVILETQASVTILEKLVLPENYFCLSGVDYYLRDSTNLKILKSESGFPGGRGGHTSRLSLSANAQAHVTTLTLSSDWSRHNIYVDLIGAGAHIGLEAAYLAKDSHFVDHHTIIQHRVGHTTSSQKYNGVLADKAKAVFNGKVVIDRDAQKSSAEQLNRNLLLSKQCEINTKPELQIDADDVQAKHGATVGQLSEEQLFYLQSRGISENVARGMLTRGFIEEIGLNLPLPLQKVFFAQVTGFVHDRMES